LIKNKVKKIRTGSGGHAPSPVPIRSYYSKNMKQKCKNCGETTKDSLAEELELCQECWEDECDKDWWTAINQTIKKYSLRCKTMTPLEKTFWFILGIIVGLLVLRNTRFF